MKITRAACFFYILGTAFSAMAQVNAGSCGDLANNYGPYDYRSDKHIQAPGDPMPHKEKLNLVEPWHFTPRVESLVGAQSGGSIGPPGADLDYTLRAFPNHHRALMSVMRYGEKTKSQQPAGLRYSVECYFERAIRFKPDDTIARMVYASFLYKNKRGPEAVSQLERATVLAADNPFTHYNIGLVYFDMKNYSQSLVQAHRAMGYGFGRMELRDLLRSVNQWREPSVESSVAPKAEQ
jgi:tetratricopeptide (TPR) repeat protein